MKQPTPQNMYGNKSEEEHDKLFRNIWYKQCH